MNLHADGSPLPTLGWLCSYTPVEIARAAGYQPVRISGGQGLASRMDPRIYHLLCPYVRTVFQRFAGEGASVPDGVVFVHCCDGMLRLHDVWKAYLPGQVHLLHLPKISSPDAVDYFADVLRSWACALGRGTGHEVGEESLREAIRWLNQARDFFRKMICAQRERPAQVPYSRVHSWIRQWLGDPTPEVIAAVRKQWEAALESARGHGLRPRVLVTSSMLDQPNLIRMIEGAGLDVVAEDECMGARHFDGDVPEQGEPFNALAERYLNKWPCSRMKGHERRLGHLDHLIEEARVQGVIALQLKYCDQAAFDLPLLKAHLEAKDMPLLIIENDYGEVSSGQLRVRIEAFAEMLEQPWT